MSHEIRTPMNGIMGVLELFEAKQLDHEQARLIKVMRDSSAVLIQAGGQSVIAEIRALQSADHGSQTALIAVGGITSPTARVLQGVDAQLQKPVSTLELAQLVDRWRGPIDPNAQQ